MSFRVLRRPLLIALSVVMLLPALPASAAPIDYVIFNTNTLLDIGSFTVDPTLANPVGTSSVELSAFSITDTIPFYGTQTITLDEITNNSSTPSARFLNGQITSISSNSGYEHPGLGILVDIVPEAPGDLNFVATFQMSAFTLPGQTNFQVASRKSIGIREAAVPEPSTLLLMAFGAGFAVRRRRKQDAA